MSAPAGSPRGVAGSPAPSVWRKPASASPENPALPPAATSNPHSMPSEPSEDRKATGYLGSSGQGGLPQAPVIERARPTARSAGEQASNHEAMEKDSTEAHRMGAHPATGRPSPAAVPEYSETIVSASPNNIIRRSLPGPMSEHRPAHFHSANSSSPVVVKPLPLAIQGSSASIHRSATSRGDHATGAAPRIPFPMNNSLGMPAEAVHGRGTSWPDRSGSTLTARAISRSATYPNQTPVQRSSASPPASGANSSPAPEPAVSLASNGANQPAAPAVNITQLANRVYELLVKRLASEQQRRGA